MKILHLEPDPYPLEARRLLEAVGVVTYRPCREQEELLCSLGEADYEAVFLRLGLSLNREALEAAPHLRIVVTPTTGLAHLDVDEVARRGIVLLSLKGETALLREITSTAEHAWGLLLALVRRLHAAHADVLAGWWRRSPWSGTELAGKTLGVVGYGRLGRMVARYGHAFGMTVLAADRGEWDPAEGFVAPRPLERLLAESDVVSLHLPLERETERLLSAKRLSTMREGAVLVNTARGELIDEAGLLAALESGHLAGAALDLLAGDGGWGERVPSGHPLVEYARRRPNLLITPHVGGYTREALEKTRLFLARRFCELVPPVISR